MGVVVAGLLAGTMLMPAQPAQVAASWYDTQLVKKTVLRAYWRQSSYTRDAMCQKFYVNPSGRFFVKLAMVADRQPGISTREAAYGVYNAFKSVC